MSGSNPPSTNGSPRHPRRAIPSAAGFLAITLLGGFWTPDTNLAHRALISANTVEGSAAGEAVALSGLTPGGTLADLDASIAAASATTVAPPTPAPAAVTPAPRPAPVAAPAPAPAAPRGGDPNDPATWDRLAGCEAGGNWATNTGNGYYGGLQFSLSSWHSVGGAGYPHENTRETQIEMGRRLQARAGWGQWPACTRSFGWR